MRYWPQRCPWAGKYGFRESRDIFADVEPALPVVRPYLRRTLSALARGAMNYHNDKRTAFVVMVVVAIVVFLLLFAH